MHVARVRDGRVFHVVEAGSQWTITDVVSRGAGAAGAGGQGDGVVRSPMPGRVIAVTAEPGAAVTKGQAVAVVEAMKMEHALVAPFDGTVSDVHVTAGASVALDAPILTVVASGE